jgi:hypothetical protein
MPREIRTKMPGVHHRLATHPFRTDLGCQIRPTTALETPTVSIKTPIAIRVVGELPEDEVVCIRVNVITDWCEV